MLMTARISELSTDRGCSTPFLLDLLCRYDVYRFAFYEMRRGRIHMMTVSTFAEDLSASTTAVPPTLRSKARKTCQE